MTNYYMDTDCLSSFLWVERTDIIEHFFNGNKVFLPDIVETELMKVRRFVPKISKLINDNILNRIDIIEDQDVYEDYYYMVNKAGFKIGKGEAATIALAKHMGGVVASNNLRDTMKYIKKFNLKYITTAMILALETKSGYITESEGNEIWQCMLSKRRRMPANSLTEYLKMNEVIDTNTDVIQ